jgi:hypothetical protein
MATLTISDGLVVHIDALADTERLAPLSAALGVEQRFRPGGEMEGA